MTRRYLLFFLNTREKRKKNIARAWTNFIRSDSDKTFKQCLG